MTCVEELKQLGIGVKGCISDNEPKMQRFREILQEKFERGEISNDISRNNRQFKYFGIPGNLIFNIFVTILFFCYYRHYNFMNQLSKVELGDPPHALQLVIKDILQLSSCAALVATAQKISEKFKNTRLRQFLKARLTNNPNQRIGKLDNLK